MAVGRVGGLVGSACVCLSPGAPRDAFCSGVRFSRYLHSRALVLALRAHRPEVINKKRGYVCVCGEAGGGRISENKLFSLDARDGDGDARVSEGSVTEG